MRRHVLPDTATGLYIHEKLVLRRLRHTKRFGPDRLAERVLLVARLQSRAQRRADQLQAPTVVTEITHTFESDFARHRTGRDRRARTSATMEA